LIFVLDLIQATFVSVPIVDMSTFSLNFQGMGVQAKLSNVMKHMPTQLQLYLGSKVYRKQVGQAPSSAWLERQSYPCVISTTCY